MPLQIIAGQATRRHSKFAPRHFDPFLGGRANKTPEAPRFGRVCLLNKPTYPFVGHRVLEKTHFLELLPVVNEFATGALSQVVFRLWVPLGVLLRGFIENAITRHPGVRVAGTAGRRSQGPLAGRATGRHTGHAVCRPLMETCACTRLSDTSTPGLGMCRLSKHNRYQIRENGVTRFGSEDVTRSGRWGVEEVHRQIRETGVTRFGSGGRLDRVDGGWGKFTAKSGKSGKRRLTRSGRTAGTKSGLNSSPNVSVNLHHRSSTRSGQTPITTARPEVSIIWDASCWGGPSCEELLWSSPSLGELPCSSPEDGLQISSASPGVLPCESPSLEGCPLGSEGEPPDPLPSRVDARMGTGDKPPEEPTSEEELLGS